MQPTLPTPSTRILIGLVVAASAVIGLVACSSTSTGTGTADGGATSTSSGSSGTASKLRNCQDPSSTCTPAENDAYDQCFITRCDAELAACYGADYKNANFSGPCGPTSTCIEACACGDAVCRARCPQPTTACSSCVRSFTNACVARCPAPPCASGKVPPGSKTCTDLALCCAQIADSATRSSCPSLRDSFSGNDTGCNSVYASYAPYCP